MWEKAKRGMDIAEISEKARGDEQKLCANPACPNGLHRNAFAYDSDLRDVQYVAVATSSEDGSGLTYSHVGRHEHWTSVCTDSVLGLWSKPRSFYLCDACEDEFKAITGEGVR